MKNRMMIIAFLIMLTTLAACSAGDDATSTDDVPQVIGSDVDNTINTTQTFDVDAAPQQSSQATQRIVIQTVDLRMIVEDPAQTFDSITALVADTSGWVISGQVSMGSVGTSARLQFRVPAAALESVVTDTKAMALSVESEQRSGEDVTSEYVDTQSRLRNLRASEDRILLLYEQANSINDTLTVQDTLDELTGAIEVLQGRLNFYDTAAAFSTISVQLLEPDDEPSVAAAADVSLLNTVEFSIEMLLAILNAFASLLIFVVIVVLPVVVLIILPGFLLWRYAVRLLKHFEASDTGTGTEN